MVFNITIFGREITIFDRHPVFQLKCPAFSFHDVVCVLFIFRSEYIWKFEVLIGRSIDGRSEVNNEIEACQCPQQARSTARCSSRKVGPFFNFPSCSRWHISLVIRKDLLGGSEMKSVNQSIIVR